MCEVVVDLLDRLSSKIVENHRILTRPVFDSQTCSLQELFVNLMKIGRVGPLECEAVEHLH
jgi:hypothetical protein